MADLIITPGSVKPIGGSAQTLYVQVGVEVTQGESLYRGEDRKYYKADSNLSQEAATVIGIALTPALADGYCLIQTSGRIHLGAALTKGELYVVGATGGSIAPFSDLVAGDWISFLGLASSASELILQPEHRGVLI